jgi:hypothetical protein
MRPPGLEVYAKSFVVGLVPFVSLFATSAGISRLCQGRPGIGKDLFLAGAVLLPLGCATLLASFFGLANLEVVVFLGVAASCFSILLLFIGLTRISGISERAAMLAIPVMLMLTIWVCKVIIVMLASNLE